MDYCPKSYLKLVGALSLLIFVTHNNNTPASRFSILNRMTLNKQSLAMVFMKYNLQQTVNL